MILSPFVKVGSAFVVAAVTWGSTSTLNSQQDLLAAYSPPVRQRYQDYLKRYRQVKTLTDFVQVYEQLQAQEEAFAGPLQKVWDKYWDATNTQRPGQKSPVQPDFDWTDGLFPGLTLQHEAEGTVVTLRPSWTALAALAKRTPQPEDDRFTALMLQLHGETWSAFPVWMQQTWDYGGCSRLGSGKHTAFLKAIQQARKGGSVFETTLKAEEKALIDNVLTSEELCHDVAPAIKELQALQQQFSWSTQQRQQLQQQLQRLRSGKISAMKMPL